MYALQRITGGVSFLFLAYHLGTTVAPKLWYGHHLFEAAPFLINNLNQEFATWTGRIIYFVGLMSVIFHFSNGLWTFCISWGLIVGPRAQRNASIIFLLFGGVLMVLGLATVLEFSLHPIDVEPTFKGAS
jgi:succinate dehydrogenase / fumarate reductase cytochrome b subunit